MSHSAEIIAVGTELLLGNKMCIRDREDSFGLVALCSVGPILAVLVLALVYQAAGAYVPNLVPEAGDSRELCRLFAQGFPVYAREMGAALAPIAAFFAVFQVVSLRMPRKNVLKIVVGLLYTYVGLVLFMTCLLYTSGFLALVSLPVEGASVSYTQAGGFPVRFCREEWKILKTSQNGTRKRIFLHLL